MRFRNLSRVTRGGKSAPASPGGWKLWAVSLVFGTGMYLAAHHHQGAAYVPTHLPAVNDSVPVYIYPDPGTVATVAPNFPSQTPRTVSTTATTAAPARLTCAPVSCSKVPPNAFPINAYQPKE